MPETRTGFIGPTVVQRGCSNRDEKRRIGTGRRSRPPVPVNRPD